MKFRIEATPDKSPKASMALDIASHAPEALYQFRRTLLEASDIPHIAAYLAYAEQLQPDIGYEHLPNICPVNTDDISVEPVEYIHFTPLHTFKFIPMLTDTCISQCEVLEFEDRDGRDDPLQGLFMHLEFPSIPEFRVYEDVQRKLFALAFTRLDPLIRISIQAKSAVYECTRAPIRSVMRWAKGNADNFMQTVQHPDEIVPPEAPPETMFFPHAQVIQSMLREMTHTPKDILNHAMLLLEPENLWFFDAQRNTVYQRQPTTHLRLSVHDRPYSLVHIARTLIDFITEIQAQSLEEISTVSDAAMRDLEATVPTPLDNTIRRVVESARIANIHSLLTIHCAIQEKLEDIAEGKLYE